MSYEDNISFLIYMAARTRNFKKQNPYSQQPSLLISRKGSKFLGTCKKFWMKSR